MQIWPEPVFFCKPKIFRFCLSADFHRFIEIICQSRGLTVVDAFLTVNEKLLIFFRP